MLPDRISNPGPLTYESDALPVALRGLSCSLGDPLPLWLKWLLSPHQNGRKRLMPSLSWLILDYILSSGERARAMKTGPSWHSIFFSFLFCFVFSDGPLYVMNNYIRYLRQFSL